MILADTSVWVDHLRKGDPHLADLLDQGRVLGHPCVLSELMLGGLSPRSTAVGLLRALPAAETADDTEVAAVIDALSLWRFGVGYVDAELLASALLSRDAALWTRDKHLATAAAASGRSYQR